MSTHFVDSLRGKLNLNAIAFRFQKAQIADSSPLLNTGALFVVYIQQL